MRVALSFDDGPGLWTETILDMLADAGAHATFFVCGWAVAERPRSVARMQAEGHDVGNHTYWHPHLTSLTDAEIESELAQTSAKVQQAGALRPALWRAPHFLRDERCDRIARTLGMEHVGCTIDSGDWMTESAQEIADRVVPHLTDGSIVDLHDSLPPNGGTGTRSRQPTVDALRMILRSPAEFVPVSQL